MYPALAVRQALGSEANPVLWVGSEGGMEEDLVKRNRIDFTAIPAAQVHGIGLRSLPRNLWQIWRGVRASRRILRQFRPDVILFTGGYVAVPMALAGLAGHATPTLLYVPDIEPGLALKVLAYLADHIAVTTTESLVYFRRKTPVTVTGYPTRANLVDWKPDQARQKLGLQDGRPVLLVAGGSKGSRSINRALIGILRELLATVQVIHISGETDWPEVQSAQASLPASLAAGYHSMPYLHEMGAALAVADLVVSRSGASTLGEYPLFGLPAILVPYPYHWDYQKVNADYLVQRGAAVKIENDRLADQLLPAIQSLISDPARLQSMRAAMKSLAQPAAAQQIASLVTALADRPSRGGTHP
jgi:UDP-N-acetylglucosamine--N-acetylmuramyl-(pentapeptide) pyrophosphoryl-undecaprenol N-acetylglucosamine transferase